MTEEMLTTDVPTYPDNAQPTEDTKWYSSLNEDYRNHPSIQKFQDVNGLAKSYLSLESMMGQEKIPVPKGDDDINAWSMYKKAFNVPESSDKYDIKIEGLDDSKLTTLKDIFYQNNIPQKTAQKLTDAYIDDYKKFFEFQDQKYRLEAQKATEELKKDWGLKYEENLTNARNFLEKMSSNQEEFSYFESKIGNDPKFIKLLSKMGNAISEGSLGGFEGQGGGFTKTPKEAKQELDRILNDPDDAYWAGARNRRNDVKYCKEHNMSFVSEEERKARVQYVNSLMAMAG